MKNRMLLLGCLAAALVLFAWPSHAQPVLGETSLFSPSRLSVGARAYRSFDEKIGGLSGTYQSAWWVGLPMAWEITSPKATQFPISIIGALDFGIPTGDQQTQPVRGYIGLGVLLKRSAP